MGLGVDEDRCAGEVAIGDPLCREAVEEALGSRKAVRFTLPESKDRAGARKPEHPAAGQGVSPTPIETAFGHEFLPAVATLRRDLWATPAKPLTRCAPTRSSIGATVPARWTEHVRVAIAAISWHTLIEPHANRPQPATLGADKGCDASDFVFELREKAVNRRIAQNTMSRRSTIDGRTTRHQRLCDFRGSVLIRTWLLSCVAAWLRGGRGAMSALAVQPLLPHPFGDFDDRFVSGDDCAFLPAIDPAHVLAGKIERTVRLQE
jgi:hypothetical protein